ncbi:MAG: HAD hydrolase-like protein [Actinomycetaceae bacterium]|nr:HAD hydrolase-like protein [Actinomycetaceae bacterium]
MSYRIALFDLDGTVTDSAEVITRCVNLTLRQLGYPEQAPHELARWVGPPLGVSFHDYANVPPAKIENAIATYRHHYRQFMFESGIFPGVETALSELKEAGLRLAVATSKREDYAAEIVSALHLDQYFEVVAGARTDDPNYTKSIVVSDALERLGLTPIYRGSLPSTQQVADAGFTGQVMMIGDRHHDIDGGRNNGLDTMGITWSGTDVSEFDNATKVAHTPAQVVELLTS